MNHLTCVNWSQHQEEKLSLNPPSHVLLEEKSFCTLGIFHVEIQFLMQPQQSEFHIRVITSNHNHHPNLQRLHILFCGK